MDVKSPELAKVGEAKIEWAARAMPVLKSVKERFTKDRPLAQQRISACLHVTAETANLVRVLEAGGATVHLCASNPLSTQDDVAAALATSKYVDVFAIRGEDRQGYFRHINAVLEQKPTITIDDSADLVNIVHSERQELLGNILGGTEETTTGVTRLKSMAEAGALKYPIIAVNDAMTKHFFDNRYGTGQSSIDGILRATNRLLAGSCFVISGYGWCGRGLAARASGMGARVVVTEVDPMRALEAAMDGYLVLPMAQAAKMGDFFCTVTGNIHVIDEQHFKVMKDGAVVCNSGHFNVELNLDALAKMAKRPKKIRDSLEEFVLADGRKIYVLGEGRLVNLAAAEGHPSDVMDMSFSNQALSAEYVTRHNRSLSPGVHSVPNAIDQSVARLKLESLSVAVDTLTETQSQYLESWQTGT